MPRGIAKAGLVTSRRPSIAAAATAVSRHCPSQRRLVSQIPQLSGQPSSGLAALTSRRLVAVSGPDAANYLQGVITSSITQGGSPRRTGFYTGFLNAQGRVLHDVFIYPGTRTLGSAGVDDHQGSFLIEVDANEAERLERHIKRYRLRARFEVQALPRDEVTVWHAWDDSGKIQDDLPLSRGQNLVLQDPRAPGLGSRILMPGGAAPQLDLGRVDERAYTIRRYLHGVAEGQGEIVREHALPLESNMDMMDGIDFRKGCYVGQELTIRTKHRGVVRKRILPCMIYDEQRSEPVQLQYRPDDGAELGPQAVTADMIPPGTSIGRVDKKGRSAGKWLAGIGNIGLGLCRLEIMTDVVLPGETSSEERDPRGAFKVDWNSEDGGSGNSVKIKAFVPRWLREAISDQGS